MNARKILEVIRIYRDYLKGKGIAAMDFPEDRMLRYQEDGLAHCYGMLDKMEGFIKEGRIEKAFRWLGFVQGGLWFAGQFPLKAFKNHNRPENREEPLLKAFLLIERHSVRFYESGPEIRKVMGVVTAESVDEVAKIIGGASGGIVFDGETRPIIRIPREMFSHHSENIAKYQKGPVSLFINRDEPGTYIFVLEEALFRPE